MTTTKVVDELTRAKEKIAELETKIQVMYREIHDVNQSRTYYRGVYDMIEYYLKSKGLSIHNAYKLYDRVRLLGGDYKDELLVKKEKENVN